MRLTRLQILHGLESEYEARANGLDPLVDRELFKSECLWDDYAKALKELSTCASHRGFISELEDRASEAFVAEIPRPKQLTRMPTPLDLKSSTAKEG